jgi:hypothetical protein
MFHLTLSTEFGLSISADDYVVPEALALSPYWLRWVHKPRPQGQLQSQIRLRPMRTFFRLTLY